MPPKGSRQQTLEAPSDHAVAAAGGFFETRAVDHGDHASTLPDEPGILKGPGDQTDRGTLDAQHLAQEFMREGKIVALGAVERGEDPPAAAGFDGMNCIAGNCLEGLRE